MRIGIIKDDAGYGRWGDDCYKKMKEHSFDCADFQMENVNGWVYSEPEEEVVAKFTKEKELAEKAGVEIWQVHGPWNWPYPEVTEEGRKKHLENCKKSIYYTSVLGCKNWVIHPLLPFGGADISTGNEQKTWDINVEFFGELVKTAEKYNVTICLENLPFLNYSLSKPDMILKLVKTINNDNFKICLDTGHVGYFEGLSVGDAVRELGKEIKVFHIHDTKIGEDMHIMPYFGKIDWTDFIAALKEIEFDGVFNLETPPSRKLDTPIFEVVCKSLAELAKEMSKDI